MLLKYKQQSELLKAGVVRKLAMRLQEKERKNEVKKQLKKE